MTTAAQRTRKGSPPRRSDKPYFGDVPPDKVFYCVNGDVYHNLYELYLGLGRMDDTDFLCHRRGETNEFSVWVRTVFGDPELADAMSLPRRAEVLESLRQALVLSIPASGGPDRPGAVAARGARPRGVKARKNAVDVALGA